MRPLCLTGLSPHAAPCLQNHSTPPAHAVTETARRPRHAPSRRWFRAADHRGFASLGSATLRAWCQEFPPLGRLGDRGRLEQGGPRCPPRAWVCAGRGWPATAGAATTPRRWLRRCRRTMAHRHGSRGTTRRRVQVRPSATSGWNARATVARASRPPPLRHPSSASNPLESPARRCLCRARKPATSPTRFALAMARGCRFPPPPRCRLPPPARRIRGRRHCPGWWRRRIARAPPPL